VKTISHESTLLFSSAEEEELQPNDSGKFTIEVPSGQTHIPAQYFPYLPVIRKHYTAETQSF